MKWFQFTLRRMMLLVLFCCIGLAFTRAAFDVAKQQQTFSTIPLRFTFIVFAAAAFGAAVGTIFRNIYNGFAIGVFTVFVLCWLGFLGHLFRP